MITAEQACNNKETLDCLLLPISKRIEEASKTYNSVRITREELREYGLATQTSSMIERLSYLGYQIILDRYDDTLANKQNFEVIEIRWNNFKCNVNIVN